MERRQKDIPLQVAETELLSVSYPILQKAGIPTSLYPDNAVYLFAPEGFLGAGSLCDRHCCFTIYHVSVMDTVTVVEKKSVHDRELSSLESIRLFSRICRWLHETSVAL